ncbi:MAG: pantetheine-phosphate adenylyltransferase, partial [Acidimicrobiia bacterium]
MTTALCPGSFDPPTKGHVDVIMRTVSVFDHVVVAVIRNPSKSPAFTAEERVEMLEEIFEDEPKVEIGSFEGLLVDYARSQGVDVIVKGLRAVTDFEYEL